MQKRKEGEEKKKVSRPKESRPDAFFRGEDEGGENARIIIDRNLQLIYEDTHNCTENRYYLFSMITTVIDPLFDLSNYSSLHCSFRICLSPKDLQQLSRARSGILFDFQMPFLGNGRTQPPRRFPILGNATIRAFLRLKRVVCSVTSGRRAAVACSKRDMRVPCSAIIARYFGSLSERSGYGADNDVYRFLPTSKKLSRVGVGDKVGGVGQTRPRLQTISSVRVPPLYLAFDRGLGVAPVRARTRKNTPPPPPSSSSFVREIRLELFYIPRVKTPPSPFSLFFSFFSPQQIEIVARHRSSPIRS